MRRPTRKSVVKIAAGVALVLLLAWVVPTFFNAEHYHGRVQRALESVLGCPVKFASLSFHLLPQPGFSLSQVVIAEPSPFAPEPLVRAKRIDCELEWASLWDRRLRISRLVLSHADLDVARDPAGQWNLATLLARTHGAFRTSPSSRARRASGFDVIAQDARLDLTFGSNTEPLAFTDLDAHLRVHPASGQLSFHVTGDPVRTDLSIPTPGSIELDGAWQPSASPSGQLNARLRTQGSLLYDWAPLLSGHAVGLYGVVDATATFSGSLSDIQFQGAATFSQLHRLNALPLAQAAPLHVHFRGSYNRSRGQWRLTGVDVAFARSRAHLSGTIRSSHSPVRLRLVASLEPSHLRDLMNLARCLTGVKTAWEISGQANGTVDLHGLWGDLQWGGLVTVQGGRVSLPNGQFPFSRLTVRMSQDEAEVAPFRVRLAPGAEATATARLILPSLRGKSSKRVHAPGEYELFLSAPSLPLADLLELSREMGWNRLSHVAAQGRASLALTLRGEIHSQASPELVARVHLDRGRLLVPGLTVPLYLPRANVEFINHQVVADPVVAVMGRSVFQGRLFHRGSWAEPWQFHFSANHLNFQRCAGWFGPAREPEPLALVRRVPGLRSIFGPQVSGADLFAGLNAVGAFATADLRYHQVHLHNFQANLQVDHQVIRILRASFEAGGGRGSGSAVLDLAERPARLGGRFSLRGASVRLLAPTLSPKLAGARGTYTLAGQFESFGQTEQQTVDHLRGSATLQVHSLVLGNFDLLEALAQSSGLGQLKPTTRPGVIGSIGARFEIEHRTVRLRTTALELGGARLVLQGSYTFAGVIHLGVKADLGHLNRPWLDSKTPRVSTDRSTNLNLVGAFSGNMPTPHWTLTAGLPPATPPRREAF